MSICKFKFTGGDSPSLEERKTLSVDAGGNLRYNYSTANSSSSTMLTSASSSHLRNGNQVGKKRKNGKNCSGHGKKPTFLQSSSVEVRPQHHRHSVSKILQLGGGSDNPMSNQRSLAALDVIGAFEALPDHSSKQNKATLM